MHNSMPDGDDMFTNHPGLIELGRQMRDELRADVQTEAERLISGWRDEADACPNNLIAAQLRAQARAGTEVMRLYARFAPSDSASTPGTSE